MPVTQMTDKKLRIDTDKIFNTHPFAGYIMRSLENAGFDAVLVGGVVRDAALANLDPDFMVRLEDIDIATSARPEEIKKVLSAHRIVEVGESFGVLILVSPKGKEYEVATFRQEEEYDGRWPGQVQLVRDLEADIKRRDFTINGLAAGRDGEVVDLVGGIRDLEDRIIDTIGKPRDRFDEDYLRMLRAIRFACYLDGKIKKEVTEAIREHATKLAHISQERIRDELFKILKTDSSSTGFRLLKDHKLLKLILPEVAKLQGTPYPDRYLPEGGVLEHTLLALEVADGLGCDPLVKLAVLLHDIGKPKAYRVNNGEGMAGHAHIGEELIPNLGRRLRLPKDDLKELKFLVGRHMQVGRFTQMRKAKQVRLMKEGENREENVSNLARRFPLFTKLLQVLVCDSEASTKGAERWMPVLKRAVELLDHIKKLDKLGEAKELIDGNDLLDMGVREGPKVGEILKKLRDEIFAGKIESREAALQRARRLISEGI